MRYGNGMIHHEKSPMPSSPPPAAPADAPLSLGIDIGGTFTDIVVIDPSNGNAVIWKESTTPDDPARGAMLGLWKLVERSGIALERIGRVIHATTLFTNALIERKGAPTGLITSWHTREQRRAARSSGVSEAIIEGLILVWYRGLGGDGTGFARTEVIRSLSTRLAPRLRRRPSRSAIRPGRW